MCTRFVYNGNDTITGFNFDIDLAAWEHTVITERDRFYIGIKMPDNEYHSFHGVNANGNVGTLLYVHGNENGAYSDKKDCYTIADLTEKFIKNELSLQDALNIVTTKKIVYAPDATMQCLLSDKSGQVLLVEPGIGYRVEKERYSLMTNYSLLQPQVTNPFIVPQDDRYEKAKQLLDTCSLDFSVADAWSILKLVHQEGAWATRVSFVYSVKERRVYYVLNNDFGHVVEYAF